MLFCCFGLILRQRAEGRGGRAIEPARKSKGCSQKTSGRSYSLKHPVARHFVCSYMLQLLCRPQALQNKRDGLPWPCRNCPAGERFTSGGKRIRILATDFQSPILGDYEGSGQLLRFQ
jgi:hypothetical protein